MAPVKLKSVSLLTGGIFLIFFFHFVPVDFGNVTILGNSYPKTKDEVITREMTNAAASIKSVVESKTRPANPEVSIASSFETRSLPQLKHLANSGNWALTWYGSITQSNKSK